MGQSLANQPVHFVLLTVIVLSHYQQNYSTEISMSRECGQPIQKRSGPISYQDF